MQSASPRDTVAPLLSDDRCPICSDRLIAWQDDSRHCDCGYSRQPPDPAAARIAIAGVATYELARAKLHALTMGLAIRDIVSSPYCDIARRWAFERRLNCIVHSGGPRTVVESATHIVSFGPSEEAALGRSMGKHVRLIKQ